MNFNLSMSIFIPKHPNFKQKSHISSKNSLIFSEINQMSTTNKLNFNEKQANFKQNKQIQASINVKSISVHLEFQSVTSDYYSL